MRWYKLLGFFLAFVCFTVISFSQPRALYFDNIGFVTSEGSQMILEVDISRGDTTHTSDSSCRKLNGLALTFALTEVSYEKLDRLIHFDTELRDLFIPVTQDTLFFENADPSLLMTHYLKHSFVLSIYGKDCMLQERFLLNGSDRVAQFCLILQQRFSSSVEDKKVDALIETIQVLGLRDE